MTTSQNKRVRDYTREYQQRQKTQKRLIADLDRQTVEGFQGRLNKKGQTYVQWLYENIEREMQNAERDKEFKKIIENSNVFS